MTTSAANHYEALFADIAKSCGPVDNVTLTGIVGFSAGGPVSMCRVGAADYVTCELSLHPEQVESSEGLKFELLSLVGLEEAKCQRLLTAIGTLSMEAVLGDRHTVDVSQIISNAPFSSVQLKLKSRCEIGGRRYGIYAVEPVGV